jgi:ribose-phosphate pyrophosphokinase
MSLKSEKPPFPTTVESHQHNESLDFFQRSMVELLEKGLPPDYLYSDRQLVLACGSGNLQLSKDIAAAYSHKYGLGKDLQETMEPIEQHVFPDGERLPRFSIPLRNKAVYIIQSPTPARLTETGQPDLRTGINDLLIELVLMIDAARRASASEINIFLPYGPYMRQDRKTRSGEPISASAILNVLESQGADSVFMLDPHSKQSSGNISRPFDLVHASCVFKPVIEELIDISNLIFLSPDTGGVKMVANYAEILCEDEQEITEKIAVVSKIRNPVTGEISSSPPIGVRPGCDVLVIDDIADSCGTLISAAQQAKQAGANKVYAAVVHGLFSGEALDRLHNSDEIEFVLTTNSIDHRPDIREEINKPDGKIKMVDIAPFLADVIHCLYTGEPLDRFFLDKK